MIEIDEKNLTSVFSPQMLSRAEGGKITLSAMVHKLRLGAGVTFVMLRANGYIVQAVYAADKKDSFAALCEGAFAEVTGSVRKETRAVLGYEILLESCAVLSRPKAEFPLDITAARAGWSVETSADNRHLSMRHTEESAVIKIRSAANAAFREFMAQNDFTEIHTPKIVSSTPAKRDNAFKLKYFTKKAYLAQSSQLFMQICSASFERIFEISPSYRGDMHNSSRHLNEFISLDFEMAYVSDLREIMSLTAAVVKYIIPALNERCANELGIIAAELPSADRIPCVTFYEALEIVGKKRTQYDLDPTDEMKLWQWARENYGSDFVFVEKFPARKRPFYVKKAEWDERLTESFDLILRGISIARGSLGINTYDELMSRFNGSAQDAERLGSAYVDALKYSLPPHGGVSMGLERLVMQLLGLDNIRRASLFPTDLHHLYP